MLNDTTSKLTSAVSSLPELLEKKRLLDSHTNIATALLDHIKKRKLDVFFETEEKLMTKQVQVRRNMNFHMKKSNSKFHSGKIYYGSSFGSSR